MVIVNPRSLYSLPKVRLYRFLTFKHAAVHMQIKPFILGPRETGESHLRSPSSTFHWDEFGTVLTAQCSKNKSCICLTLICTILNPPFSVSTQKQFSWLFQKPFGYSPFFRHKNLNRSLLTTVNTSPGIMNACIMYTQTTRSKMI